jgi:hypothetical protein
VLVLMMLFVWLIPIPSQPVESEPAT